jgi:hypothetical protein
VLYVKAAMLLTFGDSTKIQEEFQELFSKEEIENFFVNHPPLQKIFFIIDQQNVLEPDEAISHDAISNKTKDHVSVFLNKITASHRCIRSASANYRTFRHMQQK